MPKERKKVLCMDAQRHAEYYGMQQTFDELYAKSKAGEVFNGLMELVLNPDNIMLAYRNIKTNTGSYTAGTDKQNIGDIGRLPPAEVISKVRKIVTGSEHGYRPKPVRRKDIPKPNGKTRPLGIPCIWDRLVQQCIKQILEPICEAKFSNNSYGFRPNRSVEHAISRTYSLLQRARLHYVLEFDIKGFFDNVNHSKLIRQLWTLGIQDKQLLFVIKRVLKAPIRMPDGIPAVCPEGQVRRQRRMVLAAGQYRVSHEGSKGARRPGALQQPGAAPQAVSALADRPGRCRSQAHLQTTGCYEKTTD